MRILCLIILLNLVGHARLACADAITGHDKIKDAGFSEHCIDEPIFKEQACIYEINKNATKSVVLVHGINGEAANWYYQLLELKKFYHVLTFDLPGFGHSSRGNKLYSPTNYAKFIRYVTQRYVKRKFYLIGHSLGGAISLRYTAMYPADVERLVVADAGGILHRHAYAKSMAFKWLKIIQRVTFWAGPQFKEHAVQLLETLEWIPIDIRQALEIPELRQIILNGNPLPIAGVALISEDFSEAINNIKTPTLILWGAYDMVAPLRTGKLLQARLQNAYLKILPRSAHSPMADEPVVFNQLILSHLQSPLRTLATRYWKNTKQEKSKRIGKCTNNEQKTFEGAYKYIELDRCYKAIIRNVYAEYITARNSNLEIENSLIINKNIGIILIDSQADITSTDIKANIAIKTVRSRLDLAGVFLQGKTTAISNHGRSHVVFSICLSNKGTLHTFKELNSEEQIF